MIGLTPRQACNLIYALRVDGLTEEEVDEFHEELNAPLDPRQIEAERRAEQWLKGGI